MTTATIHPIVLEKLQRFRQQRQRLILWRGLCGTLAVWVGSMMVVALIDRWVLIPDGLRLGLSVAGYIATGVMFWIECGRYLIHVPDARELARLMELAAPQLREELLSAVELSETGQQPHWDSDEFRAALQQAAARDVGGLQIKGLLTKTMIAGWFKAALVVGVVLLGLLWMPGLRFPQSFARAVLPAANLARYSTVEIRVLAPTPPDQIMPEGDNVPVTVGLSGPDVQQVILETIPRHGPREHFPMALSAVNQFTAAIQLNQEPVEFRIRARDAITRKYTLTPRPRPHVVRFQKTYRPPAYSGLPVRTVTEENGDLEALEGTELELNLQVDQPIREASLQIETGSGKTTTTNLPLTAAPGGRLVARLVLTAPGTYQTHLVAAQTAFENKFSPQYEIRVRPDLIPSVKIDRPDRDQLVLPPDSVVNLAGTAKDDLALASVVQAIQVNRGEWKTVPLIQTTNAEVKVTRTWDLFDLVVTPGDRILTKLIATDRKGQRGESAPLRIMIATADFDPDRLKNLKERQALDQSIHELRDVAEQVEGKTREARAVILNPAADPVQKKQVLLAATTAAEASNRKADEVLRQIKEAIPHATDRESADLALVGSAVSRAKHEGLAAVQAAMERATEHINAGDDKAAKADLEKVLEPLAAVGLARTADDTHRQLLAAAEANAAGRDLQQLASEQRTLNDQLHTLADNPAQAERVAHRQTVAANQIKVIEDQLKTLGDHTGGNPANAARNADHDLAGNREKLEKVLADKPTVDNLKLPSEQLQHSLETAATNLRAAETELAQRADNARKNLQDQTGTAADAIAKLAEQLQRPDSPAPKVEAWQAAADQLQDRAVLEERRPHANAQFAATAGHTADALQTLQEAAGNDPPTSNTLATVKSIEQAFRKIQTGQALDDQAAALRQLAAQERWEKPTTPAAAADRANDWKWAQQQLQSLPQQLDRAQLPPAAKLAIETAGKSQPAQQIDAEMNRRRADPAAAKDVAEPLATLAGDIAQAKQQLQPALDQARTEIEIHTPALSDRLAGLARTAEKLNNDTTTQVAQAEKPENAKSVRAETKNLAAAQQRLDNRLDDVKDALRRDANAQNLAAAEGRERARDADDAVALLSKPKPSTTELLQRAAADAQPAQQQDDLKSAAEQQAKLSTDLKQLAEHYQNVEAGHPEPTRTALRETEKELGLKGTLDAEYAKAQALEKLAGLSPRQQLTALEKTLPDNKTMRHELSDIAKNAVQNAAADLQKSASQEQQLAQQIGLPAEQAKHLAAEAQKLAQQNIPAVADKAGPTGATAQPDLTNAVQKLTAVAQDVPQDFSKPPAQLAQAVQNQVAPLQQAANDLNTAANKLDQAAQAAQQQADAAAQQAKANKSNPEAAKHAQAAQQQAQAAAQQAQAAKLQAQQASQQAGQLAQQAAQLAKELAQAEPPTPRTSEQQAAVAQAKHLADEVQKLAQQDVPAVAQQAGATGETAKPDLTKAGQKLDDVAKTIPQDLSKPTEQLAQTVANQALPLQQAANDLNNAANRLGEAATAAEQQAATATQQAEQAKANNAGEPAIKQAEAAQQQAQAAAHQAEAAKQQAQQASQQAAQLAQEANQVADALNQAKSLTPAAVADARQLAGEVQKLAQQDLPAVAQQAGETAKPDLTKAGQELAAIAKDIPQDPSQSAEQHAQALQNQVAPLQLAAADLGQAAKKLGDAATVAEQKATTAVQQAEKAKADNAAEPVIKQAEAAAQQAQAVAQQAEAAKQQAQAASQKAEQLAQQANQMANAVLNPPKPSPAAVEEAKQLAGAVQKLAQQDLPAVAQQAGETAQPDLKNAGQKLDAVAKNIPQDPTKSAAQLAQALQNQVTPLQQAATDLDQAARKIGETAAAAEQKAITAAQQADQAKANNAGEPAIKQAEAAQQQAQAAAQQAEAAKQQAQEASQKAAQLAQRANQMANALSQAKPAPPAAVEQAKHIAAEAQKLAQQDLPAVAQKADETAQPDLNSAGQKLEAVAKNIPQDSSKPAAELAQAMQNQVGPLQQAAANLDQAAKKLGETAAAAEQKAATAAQQADQAKANNAGEPAIKQAEAAQQQAQAAAQQAQAAKQQTQDASQKAAQLAQQAGQMADALNQPKPTPAAVEQAKHIAAEAQKLAQQDVPAVARQAGDAAKSDLNQAGQKLAAVAKNIPQDATKSAPQLAQAMQNQVTPLQQAATDLDQAAKKLGETAAAAEHQAASAARQSEQAKANNAGAPAIKQAEAAQQQAQAAAQQAQVAKQQAQQASQKAEQLAQQATQLANALSQAQPPTAAQQAALDQARQLAEAVRKLAQQDVPAVAEKAAQTGVAAKPDLANAVQKLDGVAKNIPQESAKPAEQLVQAMQNQVAPLQQAANDLNSAAKKLGETVAAAQQQAAAAARQAAQAKAAKAGDQAVKHAEAAQQQAQAEVQQAQAAQQQAQQASQQAGQLAQQAGQVAKALDAARPPTPVQQAALDQAKQIAAAAQKLAQQNIPAVTERASEAARTDLGKAGQKLDDVAKNIPQDFSKPTEQLAQAVQSQVAPLQQAAADLNNAAKKLGQATSAAQQQAAAAARQAQQVKARKSSTPAAVERAEAAAQQAQAAAQQAQATQQQAQQASQQASQLAQQAGQAAAALNQPRPATPPAAMPPPPTPMEAAAAQQPAIAQTVRDAGNDIERAGRHEARLGQETTGQQLEQLGKQLEQQAGNQIAQTQPVLAQATDLAQAQQAVQTAQSAIQSPLTELTAAIQQPPPAASAANPSPEAPSQLAAVPEAAAKWMARALDSLDAALNPPAPVTGQPVQPGQPQPGEAAPANPPATPGQSQPGQPSQPTQAGQPATPGQPQSSPAAQASQAAQNAAALASVAAAQAQSAAMMSARANGLAPGQQPMAQSASSGGAPGARGNMPNTGELPEVKPAAGNWGKLPPKLARDLMDSQHEGVGGEYRDMVDMYFRAIADKAREKQQP